MTNPDGSILNFYCELPHSLDARECGDALLEIDIEITGMTMPPVASVGTHFVGGASFESLEAEIEDYRRFYVEFEPHATEVDAANAVRIVFGALKRLSSK